MTCYPQILVEVVVGSGWLALGLVWLTLSLPVYLFRVLVGWVVAPLWRPDLGPLLDLQSAALVADYLETEHAPRCNYVLVFRLHHAPRDLFERVKRRLQTKWIEHALNNPQGYYRRLVQVPTTFLGFPFWQPCRPDRVGVTQHVSRLEKGVEVEQAVEDLLNTHLPRHQSPWSVVVHSPPGEEEKAVLLFRMHHCLADGFGMLRALLDALFNETVDNVYVEGRARPAGTSPGFRTAFALPVALVRFLALTGRRHACSVPNAEKKWRQLVTRTGPISMETVKGIKNAFGVSFTSVLLSALLTGTSHALRLGNKEQPPTAIVFSALPLGDPRRRKELTNCATGTVFPVLMPSAPQTAAAADRLRDAHAALESARDSPAPLGFRMVGAVGGAHFTRVTSFQNENRWISVGLTNFSGLPAGLVMDESLGKGVYNHSLECFVGALRGNAGIAAVLLSHEDHVGIQISAEEALFSRDQLRLLTQRLLQEVDTLKHLAEDLKK